MNKIGPVFYFLFFILFFSSVGSTDIYKFIDANGVLHFTNAPSSNKYRLYFRERMEYKWTTGAVDRYDDIILLAAQRYNISFSLLKAIIKVESDFNPLAVSKKGAKGLMQLMPESISDLQVENPFDPQENVMSGARYFRQLLDRFNGEIQLSLAAYNAGPNLVDRYNRIPPFKETEEYIHKVMTYYYSFEKG